MPELSAVLIPILNALSLIFILLLIAMGLAVIFGLMGIINLAHGEFFMLGAYALFVTTAAGLSPWVGLLVAPLALAVVALLVERGLIRRLSRRPLETLLATWGLSILLRQGVEIAFGKGYRQIPHPLPGSLEFLGVTYPAYRTFLMAASAGVITATYLLLYRTDFGLQMRAVIQNPEMAAALGIHTRRIYQVGFVVGAALAGFAGALMAPLSSVYPSMGLDFVVEAFFVVIVGGLGTLLGLVAGAVTIGGVESLFSFLTNAVVARIVVLVLAIGIIQFKPRGLFG